MVMLSLIKFVFNSDDAESKLRLLSLRTPSFCGIEDDTRRTIYSIREPNEAS